MRNGNATSSIQGGSAGPLSAFVLAVALSTACDAAPEIVGKGAADPPSVAAAPSPLVFVGRETCSACHAAENAAWSGSHHDLAMSVATPETVLGDFDGATLTHFGVTSRFDTEEGRFVIETDGPDGALEKYEIAYAFGVAPLQQYLVKFPGGRVQALPLAWDARSESDGGQRWFHLYPDQALPHGDPLHWTRSLQNWNFMCAECHSTDLQKSYDSASRRYATTFAEIDVSCEACHGPGSRHVRWASAGERQSESVVSPGHPPYELAVDLADRSGGAWIPNSETGIAARSRPRSSQAEVETCARCHARRSVVTESYVFGRPILDTHLVASLDERLYHADGQIDDEVYVYGSFLQSKMYAAGVSCSDCHDPHSNALLGGTPDATCMRCHAPETFAVRAHHLHENGTPGASCVACHMPQTTYMVVDPRRDHSFRVPRPDLSVAIGTPNACTGCHTDRNDAWAAAVLAEARGAEQAPPPHYGEALHAGRTYARDAVRRLGAVAHDEQVPGIARRTALELLARFTGAAPHVEAIDALRDPDPHVRLGALRALEPASAEITRALVAPLFDDPVRSVRIEAARIAVSIPGIASDPAARASFARATADLRSAHWANADRAEAWIALGAFEQQLGRVAAAEEAYGTALELEPDHVEARVNLADLRRVASREPDAEALLREALAIAPENGDVRYALALALVRQGRHDAALPELARATELAPQVPRYAYVYAVALDSTGDRDAAIAVLRAAHERMPGARTLMFAMASMQAARGEIAEATTWARELLAQDPADAEARALSESLARAPASTGR